MMKLCTVLSVKSYVQQDPLEDALEWLDKQEAVDSAVYSDLLRRCGNAKALSQGRRVHSHIARCGRERETYVGNYLIEMYGKCGEVEQARRMFEAILERNVFSWNLMISAYARQGHSREAFIVFRRIDLEGVKPSRVTFLSVLDCCTGCRELAVGVEVHARIAEAGLTTDVVVSTSLVKMYGRCSEDPAAARSVFDSMELKDLVSWNTMITVYAQKGRRREAVRLYWEMQVQGVKPDKFNFCSVIFACSSVKMVSEGRRVHQHVIESGLEHQLAVGNALVNMYGKHGDVRAAREVFDRMVNRDMISWTSMIVAYSQKGQEQRQAGVELLNMMSREKLKLDRVGYTSVIDACTSLGAVEQSRIVHLEVAEQGLECDTAVGSALVNMYGKLGKVEAAKEAFEKLTVRDRCAWTSMLGAFAQNGRGGEAFQLFQKMDMDGEPVDSITLITVLSVCSSSSMLAKGKAIHRSISGSELEHEELVTTALVDMYARCGSLVSARAFYETVERKADVFLWSALISGYSQHGDWEESMRLFREMQVEGLEPDDRTMTSVLSGLSHGGVVDQAREWFATMVGVFDIKPALDHYMCMVDLLCRAGCLEDAEKVMKRIPGKPDVVAWTTLMGSCTTQGDVVRGARAAEHVQREDDKSSGGYVSMRNIFITR